MRAASSLVLWAWEWKVTKLTGTGSWSSNAHIGGGITHWRNVVTRILSAKQLKLVKHWNHSLQSSIVKMPYLQHKCEIVHCLKHFRDSSIIQELDNGHAYLHQSLPHCRCHGNHCHGCAECSSPSRRCSWPILESGGGDARASPDPNTHTPEPWGAHCRNANSASDTSDNSQQSTAELWKK